MEKDSVDGRQETAATTPFLDTTTTPLIDTTTPLPEIAIAEKPLENNNFSTNQNVDVSLADIDKNEKLQFLEIPKTAEMSLQSGASSIASNSTTPTLKSIRKVLDFQDAPKTASPDEARKITFQEETLNDRPSLDSNAIPLLDMNKESQRESEEIPRGSFQDRTSQDAAKSPHSLPFGLKEEEWVDSCAPVTDDPSTPAMTFRVFLLGLIWSIFLATVNTLFSFRKNHFRIPISVVVLLSYPMYSFHLFQL